MPLRKWAVAIYVCLTSLKSVSSMKLHRDIKVSQPTAWFMLHRIREAWANQPRGDFEGAVEVDESYFGGRRRNMSNSRRKALADTGRGAVGKTAVVGIRDRATKQVRAKVTDRVDTEHLQGFVVENTKPGAKVYTDDASAYDGLPFAHESVRHSVLRVRQRHGPYQWSGVILGHVETGAQRDVPQAVTETPGSLRPGVRSEAQYAGLRNAYANAGDGCPTCWS